MLKLFEQTYNFTQSVKNVTSYVKIGTNVNDMTVTAKFYALSIKTMSTMITTGILNCKV